MQVADIAKVAKLANVQLIFFCLVEIIYFYPLHMIRCNCSTNIASNLINKKRDTTPYVLIRGIVRN